MQVPEHVVSLYVATCGQNGPGLGSDEKEIILLVYVIIEAATGQIIGTKQLLVRPAGNLVKDRTVSTSSETSNSAASPTLNSSTSSITTTNEFNNSNTSVGSNNNNSSINNTNGPTNNNNNSLTTSLSLLDNNNQIELPIAVAQAAGKPLNEAIEEFDEYLRSLSLVDVDFKLITDGQKPLRQCLHREACAKDIELPTYYNKFCDLRKEFLQYRAGDLSRALVPMKDIKKILQMPVQPQPQSIDEMMKDLNITSTEDMDFYIRESRDMITVIQAMLKGGHKFTPNEDVNLVLEPGICSIDDEIDGNCIVRARGLPWQSSDQDIAKFFRGLNVAKGGVALCLSPLGRRNGEALVRFISQEHRDMALKRHKHHIGNRYIEVYPATGEDFLAIAGGASNEAQAFLSKGAQVIIRMRGLPYDCTAKQVLDFFTTGEKPCNVLDGVEGVLFVKKPDGRATGDAFVLFANEADAPKALSRHRESIGQRYIELFRSTTAEVQQVLNRSMDPKTYEPIQQAPLIAQLPTMQLSLLPQHLITSGTTKNCIRLRGLPYEALVEHILHFLDDFAKHIIYQGVHMVINAQGQPSGEAFIQMDSEDSARVCAQRKHNQFMVFGKKYRYIEVFQCSGDDMNMVLNGGLQSPVNPHHAHLTSAGKQPPLLSPGMLAQPPPPTAHALSTHSHLHAHHPHSHAHSHTHVNQHHHSLQSSNATAVASAALAHQPHQHMSLVGTPPQVPAVGSMAPYLHHAATGTAHTQHPSLTAVQNNAAAAAAAAVAAQSAVTLPQSHLQLAPTTGAGVSNPHSALSLPFNITLPPPQQQSTNSALLAQQQAQFIAQHNLLARQQAAAVAVEQQQQQFYANLMMQHHAAAAAAAQAGPTAVAMSNPHTAGGQPQFVLMPRPYFQPFPIGYMPQSYQFAGSPGAAAAAAAACSAASGLPTGGAGMHSPALPHSMKRSYEHAFQQQQDANVASAAKRALTRPGPGPGASVIGSPFGHFATFGPPTPLIASPHRTHHAHPHHAHHHAHHPHHPHAHPAAFYPAPLVYWPYPSPPVSPTTYYSQPTHTPTHVAAQHQTMYPVDYITATAPTNYVAQAPPMSPPSISIQAPSNSAGIMLTPNKTQVLPMVSNKHYPPLPSVTTTLPIPTTASVVYQSNNHMAHMTPTTYSAATPMHINNVYTTHQPHNNLTVAAVTSSAATPSTQALLTIDTSTQGSERMSQSFKAVSQCAAVAAAPCAANNLVGVVTAAATPVAAASVNGQPHMSNQCVELYIS